MNRKSSEAAKDHKVLWPLQSLNLFVANRLDRLLFVCNKGVGWRFRFLDEPFRFVMITFPGDYHLATKQTEALK